MVRSVEPEQLERLQEVRHRTKMWAIVIVGAVAALTALLISLGAALPVGLCVVAGLGIGRLANAPFLRLLKELGLTRHEGLLILAAERDRLSGRAALPPHVRAQREQRLSRVCTAGGLVAAAVFVVAAFTFFSEVNKPVDENAPEDVWLLISAIAGFVTLVLAPALLLTAFQHRAAASAWRAKGRSKVTGP